MIGLFIELTK